MTEKNFLRITKLQDDLDAKEKRVRELEACLEEFAACADYIAQIRMPFSDDTALWAPQTNTGEQLPKITVGTVKKARRLLEGK